MVEVFPACPTCPVRNRCLVYQGEKKLSDDYLATRSFCGANDLVVKAVQLAGIKDEYLNANLDTFVTDKDNEAYAQNIIKTMEKVEKFVTEGKNLILLHPNKGTGKTYSANAILNEWIYAKAPSDFDYEHPIGLYVKFGRWANELRDGVKDDEIARQARKLCKQMMDVPLLVVDDIGSGRITPYIQDLFYDVVDHRKETQKATIYTTNLPEAILVKDDYLGEMIVSRIFYNSKTIMLGGRDRRKQTRK